MGFVKKFNNRANPYLYPANSGGELPAMEKECYNHYCSVIVMADLCPGEDISDEDKVRFEKYGTKVDMRLYAHDIETLIDARLEMFKEIEQAAGYMDGRDYRKLKLLEELDFWQTTLAELRLLERRIKTLMN